MWRQLWWGEFERAIQTCDAGIELATRLGVPPVQYGSLKCLVFIRLGRFDAARSALDQEVSDAAHPFGRAMRGLAAASFDAALLAHERAAEVFGDVENQARRLGRPWMERWARQGQVLASIQIGRLDAV